MRAIEFITEVFQPGKTNWKWRRQSSDEAFASFIVADREYQWHAFTSEANLTKWEIQFRLMRVPTDPDGLDLFGTTGTGNSAEVLSTAVDITREFIKQYGLDKVEEITFNAKEDSRIGLYAKMINRLLPDWDLYQKYSKDKGMEYHLTDRRAYDKPENKTTEGQGVAEGSAETSWSNDTDTITLQDILELTKHIKQINLPINDNLKSKLLHWEGNPEEIERVNQVTVSNQFPILIMVDEQGQIAWILDGNHRLHKAIQSQAKTIPAKLIRPSNLDDKAKKIFNIKEQGVTEGTLSIDVPNEDWLQDKIDYAKSKGRNSYGVPYFGSTTAYVRGTPPQVRVMRLASLQGMKSEQLNVRKNDLKWLMDYMETNKKLPPKSSNSDEEYLPYIMVAYNGEAWVNEGNHRIMAAYRLNWQTMPIELRYFDGGERVKSGDMYPEKIGLSI